VGVGVVGGGVWALCAPRDDLNVKRVLLRSPKEGLPEEVVTFNADDILNDPEIDTVVEVMGGLHPAYEYVSAALARGKNVVTANKALIAAYYTELTALAREKGAALRCTLFQLLGKHRFQIAAVVHAGKEIVAHILAAQLPLPGRHALFRQHIACQRCAHFQLPAFAVRFHSAVQHTVHTAIAQLVVHPQAIVLPAVTKRCFGQGHCLKYGLR